MCKKHAKTTNLQEDVEFFFTHLPLLGRLRTKGAGFDHKNLDKFNFFNPRKFLQHYEIF